jgi:3-hydroxybutyryl-CoA dehydrogenase
VLVERDVPGFVWNRLQLALLREAVWIVEHGVATPETVDTIVRDGLARRWTRTGPFETAALGGAETFERIARFLFPELSTATEIDNLRQWLLDDQERLAGIREARDAGLVSELRRERAEA